MSHRHLPLWPTLFAGVLLAGCAPETSPDNDSSVLSPSAPLLDLGVSKATVFATGLQYPRGFTFGPNGTLYVAEGASGRIGCRRSTWNNPRNPGPTAVSSPPRAGCTQPVDRLGDDRRK